MDFNFKNITKQKKIELIILAVIIIWALLFLINYIRYTNSKPPIPSIKIVSEYDDGKVTSYISLGYKYIVYDRVPIQKEELLPIWGSIENPESNGGLPETYKDYNVPVNTGHADNYKGLVYFYSNSALLGTYKCINTSAKCKKVYAGYDEYNLKAKSELTKDNYEHKFGIFNEKFTFIDDSKTQDAVYGEPQYTRIIYLFNIEENEILAEFRDIKESIYDDYYENSSGENNNFIIKSKDTNKWGVIHIDEEGNIEEKIPAEYQSIEYDNDTEYYILCKNSKWSVYDLKNDKTLLEDIETPIYDIWYNSNKTYYYKTGIDRTVGSLNYTNYSIYKFDKTPFLVNNNITEILGYDKFVLYVDKEKMTINIIDYVGRNLDQTPINFLQLSSDEYSNPSFKIKKIAKESIEIYVYQGREVKYDFEDVILSTIYEE